MSRTKPTVAMLSTIIRPDEKAIIAAFAASDIALEIIDVRKLLMKSNEDRPPFQLILNRCISQMMGSEAVTYFESFGLPCLNASAVIDLCGDKAKTTFRLCQAGLSVPRTIIAQSAEAALEAMEEIGFPLVLKPVTGSWGRLLAKVNDRDAAVALVEHKDFLGGPQHKVFYVQDYIDKPDRDIRVMVIGETPVASYYRYSADWRTNVARGASTERADLPTAMLDMALAAAAAVGGGILSVDLLEAKDGRVFINEINHTMEFGGATAATGIDIAGHIVRHVRERLQ